jgi:probable HAF family extracellular repeat protein
MEEDMKSILTWITAVAVLPVLAAAQSTPRYTVTDLGNVGAVGTASSLSNTAVTAGAAVVPSGAMHAVLWLLGIKLDIGARGLGGPNSEANAVNVFGQTAGAAQTSVANDEDFCAFNAMGLTASNTSCLPFLWQYGVMTKLPTLGGANGFANSINNLGQAAGWAETANKSTDPGCPVNEFLPVTWQNGQAQQLPVYTGDTTGVAWQVNDHGQAVGASGNCTPLNPDTGLYMVWNHALLWENGKPTDLGNFGGTGGLAGNHACGINNHGQVVGHAELADNSIFHGFLWTQPTGMQDLGTLPGDVSSLAISIAEGGQIVGASLDANFDSRAVIWENGTITDLNTLIPANSPLYLVEANSINSVGEIVGVAVTASGDTHGFMLVPR